jgi:hypothetical protein
MRPLMLIVVCVFVLAGSAFGQEGDTTYEKPRAAVFPVGGTAPEDLRDRVAFAVRQKLERTELYEVIDGYTMKDLAAEASGPITFDTKPEELRVLASYEDADLIAWGDLNDTTLRMKVLDLRDEHARLAFIEFSISRPQDLRFATEEVVEAFPGVLDHTYVSDEAVQDDAESRELWEKNPNLVTNPDFNTGEDWWALYGQKKWNPPYKDSPPAEDEVVIVRDGDNYVLAMKLSRWCAENPGMSVISKEFKIEPNTRYRISFRYKSDSFIVRPFVKGYTEGKDIAGEDALREVYRRQVPLEGSTNGEWKEVVCDLNPQHPHFPVHYLKVTLYAYLTPGTVMWDDVQVKAVGKPTRQAEDVAIKKPTSRALERPTTRPRGTKG